MRIYDAFPNEIPSQPDVIFAESQHKNKLMQLIQGQTSIKLVDNEINANALSLGKPWELITFNLKINAFISISYQLLETLSNMIQAKKLVILILFFVGVCANSIFAQDRYFRIKAKKGDSAERLMQRYHLDDASCNLDRFFQINKLKKNAMLLIGKQYYLPVLIFDYNGKSIRTTLGLSGWEDALRIKKYNERLLRKKLRSSTIAKSNIIWVPYHELGCNRIVEPEPEAVITEIKPEITPEPEPEKVEEKIKPAKTNPSSPEALLAAQNRSSGYRKFPIFGKKYEHIPLIDNNLKGKVYYIVSGHGGPDPGALGKNKNKRLCEDEYAYDVGLRLCRNLLEHGATVYMIIRDPDDGLRDGLYLDCDRDEYCWGNKVIPLNQKKRLKQRANAVNDLYRANLNKGIKDQTLVTIHIDSRTKAAKTDVFFYHYPKSKSSRALALQIHETFKQKYAKYRSSGEYHGSVTGRDLYMLRYTDPKAVFIELGNIRNDHDQKRFIYQTNREALAKWLYEGLTKK